MDIDTAEDKAERLASLLASAFPHSQHPVRTWRIIASGEMLWSGPVSGPSASPVSGPRGETYAEHVNRIANTAGYTKGFGQTAVYDMVKRVRYFDLLDRGIMDYLEALPIPRAGLASVLDGLIADKAAGDVVMQTVKDWLAERGTFAKAAKQDVDPVERDVTALRAMLDRRPADSIDGKRFRALAIELLCAA